MKTFSTNRPVTFTHAFMLARYNLPLYIFAAIAIVLGLIAACFGDLPLTVRMAGVIAAIVGVWYALASFFAFHLMFDCSNLLSGEWLVPLLPDHPRRWAQVSIVLEETTLPLGKLFPSAEGRTLDLFDSKITTEPAIARARESSAESGATKVSTDALPIADDWADLTVVMLAAHEIRDRLLREKLFGELRRVTSGDGTIVLIEHLRNFAAFSAFGPLGFFHFYPRKEWIRLAKLADLKIRHEFPITPFVQVFVLTPQGKVLDGSL